MTLGFNTNGNSQTNGRTTNSVLLGKLRNSIGSTTRKFKYCNSNSPDLNFTFNCLFNGQYNPGIFFENYHIINTEEIPIENITDELPEELPDEVSEKSFLTKSILRGPFTPNQIKRAYSINNIIPLQNIRRPIVTIIAAFNNPFLARDIASFGRVFNLPPCNYTIHNFSRNFSVEWAVEVTLNVQWIYAINPYSQIRIVLAASNSSRDMFNAVNFANNRNNFRPAIDTDIISMSWGTPDTGNFSSFNNFFTNPNTIYIAASGNSNQVSVPSSCSNVLAIGGTSLNINSSFNRVSERVWSRTGSGYSMSFNKPTYQPTISSNNKRITPDFSCVADPNTGCFIIINNRAYSIGGPSLAAPLYAGMLSLLTQNRLNKRLFTYTSVQNRANSIQPLLYNSNNNNCFFDVTQGSSSIYTAGTGFDIASGNGVLNLNNTIGKIG